jgi:hypothetical protein
LNDKIRPVHERLAQIEGSTTFKDLREGFGGGFANVTQQDLMAGLAIVRSRSDPNDIAPEILETYFGSTQKYRRTLVATYVGNTAVEAKHTVPHRMAATLAAQMLAGMKFHRDQDEEFAYICNTRLQTLRDMRSHAISWFNELLDRAIPKFADALRNVINDRGKARAERLVDGSLRHDQYLKEKREKEEAKKVAELDPEQKSG